MAIILTTLSAFSATVVTDTAAPTVDGADIAQLTQTDSDFGTSRLNNDRQARGQTFTTGSNTGGYSLLSFTMRTFDGKTVNSFNDGAYVIRVGTISGTDFTQIATDATLLAEEPDLAANDYVTWTFSSAVTLAANTLYGIDVAKAEGSGTQYFRNTDDSSLHRRNCIFKRWWGCWRGNDYNTWS